MNLAGGDNRSDAMKPSEAFRGDAPLPRAALENLAYLNRKDDLIEELEEALRAAKDELRAYEQADWVGRCQEAERKVQSAHRYIDAVADSWRRDIRVARDLIEEKGLTAEYRARLEGGDA